MESKRQGQSKEDFDSQIIGEDVITLTAGELVKKQAAERSGKKVKAVLFVSEHAKSIDPDMDIQVVAIDPAGLNAIIARRC